MRVNPINRAYEVYKSQETTPAKKVKAVAGKDKVELSTVAKDYRNVYKMATEAPDIRQDKVDLIKEQLKSGTYNIKTEEVVEKMMTQFDFKG